MFGLLIRLAEQIKLEHVEVIGHDQPDFFVGPGLAGSLFLLFLGLLDNLEAKFTQLVVGLAGLLAAAEIARRQDFARQVPASDADGGLWRVVLALMHQLVARGLAEGMLDSSIKVGQGLQDVLSRQTFGNRLWHGRTTSTGPCRE